MSKTTTFEGNNAITPTDYNKLYRGKTPTAYFRSLDAKLDNYIRSNQMWDKSKMWKDKFNES